MKGTVFAAVLLAALVIVSPVFAGGGAEISNESPAAPVRGETDPAAVPSPENAQTAVFAGGCFWCMEEAYEKVTGVIDAVSGYAGGTVDEPTYYQVTSGTTGHTEVVQVIYDPELVSYEDLLYVFWRNIDLLDAGGQFCDRGDSYRTGIFYSDDGQRRAAERSKQELERSGRFDLPIVTEITELDTFWIAEDFHQNYYVTDSIRYNFYKEACGRERRLVQLWGDEAGGSLDN